MKNFARVFRLALRYRWTFAASLGCALAVALLWGANIGAVYPFVEVVFQGKSLQNWVDEEIRGARQTADEMSRQAARCRELSRKTPAEQEALLRQWIDEEQAAAGPDAARRIGSYRDLLKLEAAGRGRKLALKINLAESRRQAEQQAEAAYRRVRPWIYRYLPNDPFRTLALITGLLLMGTIVKDLFLISNNVLVARLAELAAFRLRKLFYRRTLRLDLGTFTGGGTADLMSRFTYDMDSVTQGLVVLFGRLVREPLKMFACLIGAGLICWRLLLLSLLIAPLAAFLIHWLAKALKRVNRKAMEEMAKIYAVLEETLRGIKIVKAFTSERQERQRFHRRAKEYYKKAMKIARYDALGRPITEIMGIVTICLALLAGAYLVLANETHLLGIRMSPRPLSLGSLLLFYGLLAGAADPIRKLSDVFTRLQRALAASDRIYSRLDRRPQIRDVRNAVSVKRHGRDLVFDGVTFGYQADRRVLEEIHLGIEYGQTVALIGPNGCGKSTLANLIPRFYDPTAGEIRLDGVPLPRIRLRDLRRQIGVVTQETLLFDDTVYNNIRYGSPGTTRAQVIEAARRAHAHEFIEHKLAEGYQTVVGPMGARLSGGQRQRIALARAILRNPAILILDEATSQVDLESQAAIQEVLEEFLRDRTAVIISHRLAVLNLADQIVVMQSGRILDTGRHAELLGRCGLYRRLHQIEANDPDEPLAA